MPSLSSHPWRSGSGCKSDGATDGRDGPQTVGAQVRNIALKSASFVELVRSG